MMDHETFVLDGIMVIGDTKDATELVDSKYDGVWRSGGGRSRLGDVTFVDVGVGNKVWIREHIGVTVQHGLDGRGVELLIHDFMMQSQYYWIETLVYLSKTSTKNDSNYDGMEAVAIQE